MRTKFLLVLIALTFVCPIFGQSGITKRVAILETVDKEGKVSYGVKLMVRSKLSAVITATPGYEGYDRVDVSSILGEHEFQRTGLVSDSDIKRLGEMTGADYILVAEVAYLNDSYIFLSAKILNVETARVEQTADTQTEATVAALEQNCKVLAGKLLNVNAETGAVRGELTIYGGRYIGEHKNGEPHGQGIFYFPKDDSYGRTSYEGNWAYGRRSGKGTMKWKSGAKYVGEWKSDLREGYGTQYHANGNRYEGYWEDGKENGEGTYYWVNGDKEVANYVNGKKNGEATKYYSGGRYETHTYKNDVLNGAEKVYYSSGKLMREYWYVDGKITYKSRFYNNK